MRFLHIAAMLAASAAANGAQAQTIGASGPSGGTYIVGPTLQNSSVGQSFVSPGTVLSYFTFNVANTPSATLDWDFVVAEYNPATRMAGTELHRSNLSISSAGDVAVAPNVNLTLGQTYIAYVTEYGQPNTASGDISIVSDQYGGGEFLRQASSAFDPTTNGWTNSADYLRPDADLRFSAVFNAPEPLGWALMIAGFGAVGGAPRRRRVNLPRAAAA